MCTPDQITISEDGRTVEHMGGASDCEYVTVYGKKRISSNGMSHFRWKFKIICENKKKIKIGIISHSQSLATDTQCDFSTISDVPNYAYCADGSKCSNGQIFKGYGHQWNNGDVVEMILDLEHSCISFFVNHRDNGIAYKIQKGDDIHYSMAVSLYCKSDKIELIKNNQLLSPW